MMCDISGDTPILGDLKIAEGLIQRDHKKDIGMILLFESSTTKKGKSKKTNKPYRFTKINLSDGYTTVECTWWDCTEALGWPKNSLVYVQGKLSTGWSTSVNITIKKISAEYDRIIDEYLNMAK